MMKEGTEKPRAKKKGRFALLRIGDRVHISPMCHDGVVVAIDSESTGKIYRVAPDCYSHHWFRSDLKKLSTRKVPR